MLNLLIWSCVALAQDDTAEATVEEHTSDFAAIAQQFAEAKLQEAEEEPAVLDSPPVDADDEDNEPDE